MQEDLKFLAEFTKDPDKVMIDAGIISEEVRNTIKSGDEAKIRRLLAANEAAAAKEAILPNDPEKMTPFLSSFSY